MWVVSIGSLVEGHKFLGPFDTEEEADNWIDNQPEPMPRLCWSFEVKSIEFAERVLRQVKKEQGI